MGFPRVVMLHKGEQIGEGEPQEGPGWSRNKWLHWLWEAYSYLCKATKFLAVTIRRSLIIVIHSVVVLCVKF